MSKKKILTTTALTLLTIVLAPTFLPTIPKAYGTNQSITLVGIVGAWNNTSIKNPTITVQYGDVISLSLISGDTFVHRFIIDVANRGKIAICPPDKCSVAFGPDNTLYTFTVDFPIGRYTYFCSVHPTTMVGTFTVAYASPPLAFGGRGPMPV